MPLYEYRCNSCSQAFALLRPMVEATSAATCPTCGSTETERLISACAIGSVSGAAGGGFS